LNGEGKDMSNFPWYMRDYWFSSFSLIIIIASWLFKRYTAKYALKVLDEEKFYPFLSITWILYHFDKTVPPALSGKEAIRMAKIIARAGDLLFWVVLFSFLIFAVSQFENIFMGH
jgi:hypothetical protein